MTTLHMVELRPDITALLYFLRDQGLETRGGDENLGYGIHAWFGVAFGEQAPKPWRLFMDRRRPTRSLAIHVWKRRNCGGGCWILPLPASWRSVRNRMRLF